MIYIWKWLFFDCGPAEVVCVCWLWKSLSWLEGCFWSLRGIGHIQFVLLNGSFCESFSKFIDFSQCLMSQWWPNTAFFCSFRMTHATFCPSFSWSLSFHPLFSFFIPSFSLILYDLHLCLVFWIYCTYYCMLFSLVGQDHIHLTAMCVCTFVQTLYPSLWPLCVL